MHQMADLVMILRMSEKIVLRALEFVEVDPNRAGQRLDNFLFTRLKGIPKSVIYRILRTGQVRVNKGRVKPHYKLQGGDMIRIPPLRPSEAESRPMSELSGPKMAALSQELRERVLSEDHQIIILNKPAGLAVHGGSGLPYGLIEVLKASSDSYAELELVHRLDRGTSGCLLLAKNHKVLRQLHELLRLHQVEKTYLALLQGTLQKPISINAELGRSTSGGQQKVSVVESGKAACTHIVPQQHYGDITLAKIQIETGRTHQIRVHCASFGHPLAGDDKYGDRVFNRLMRKKGLKRVFLHASSVRFTLDQTYSALAALPVELQAILDKLAND